ncbi:HNH endonuclease [Stenotrophomonas sp. MMGLT7]|uniref:HNH endonuclease n=1 Tax=Stenotrophomonas sp. MMGLT7 TaxID=2901227 RepID=UPI001E358EA6|nr:HNH endonuclease [Stenotrophomonas sp. MMGLT7]MCD7096946.1 HNH endonuclease [Stenotrophomonas sp. MMGLT7]
MTAFNDEMIVAALAAGKYSVTCTGAVYNEDWRGRGRRVVVAQRCDANGYFICNWKWAGKRAPVRVHRVVLLAFMPRADSAGFDVNHIDGIKAHNSFSNLEWVTESKNIRHAYKLGLRSPIRLLGEEHPQAKLKEGDVRRLHELSKNGVSLSDLAVKFGIGKTQVIRIIKGLRWNHIYQEFHP